MTIMDTVYINIEADQLLDRIRQAGTNAVIALTRFLESQCEADSPFMTTHNMWMKEVLRLQEERIQVLNRLNSLKDETETVET